MLARNLLPSPAPSLAPLTMPAMSTNDTVAGTIFAEWNSSASRSSRGPAAARRHVRLDGGERVVRGQHVGPGQGVEHGGLADVGQPDDAEGETHEASV